MGRVMVANPMIRRTGRMWGVMVASPLKVVSADSWWSPSRQKKEIGKSFGENPGGQPLGEIWVDI